MALAPPRFPKSDVSEPKPRGCLATLVLLVGLVVGAMIAAQVALVLVICLQYGPNAYFVHGLRRLPGRTFGLNNGERISIPLQVVWVGVSGAALWIWKTVWTPAVIAIEELISPASASALPPRRTRRRPARDFGPVERSREKED